MNTKYCSTSRLKGHIFRFSPQEVKEDQKALLGQAQNSMKAVLAVQKVFMALQVQIT